MISSRIPLFIVVEGLDGVGKTTVVRELARELAADILHTPPVELAAARADILRCFTDSPLATTLFYASTLAAAAQQAAARRAAGRSVVLDRYYLSTCAYGEVLRGNQHPRQLLDGLAALLLPADVTIYLHASSECRRERMQARGQLGAEDRLSAKADIAERLEAAFASGATHHLVGRWLPVDTMLRTSSGVVATVLNALSQWGLWAPPLPIIPESSARMNLHSGQEGGAL